MKGSLMPQGYHHLTQAQRCQIYGFKGSRMNQQKIAKELGVSQATISRELKRNAGKRGYRYKQAHEMVTLRMHVARAIRRKMTPGNIDRIEKMLKEDQLSPEQISGRMKLLGTAQISHESIYQHIWKDKRSGGLLYKHLRRSGKKYNKRSGKLAGRGLIPNRVDIALRPVEVAAKSRVGDFEGDTIIGKEHRGAIMTMVERKTKVTLLHLLTSTKSDETAAAIIKRMFPIKELVLTITTDNGKEFAKHESIAESLKAKFFFAQPYHSWERGLNENTNGLIRQYFSKGADFSTISPKQILEVEQKLNNRPRKTLGYRTPSEEFLRLTGVDLNYALQY